jgi:membrane-bound serine protease (ClpP class)
MKKIVLTILFFSFVVYGQDDKEVGYLLTIDGAINPATSDYIKTGLEKADSDNAEFLIIKLNTPGGLLKSTRIIVSDLLDSPIPTIVYVAPSGAQAASAGTFITMAAHVAVMAEGTNIGAASPVTMQGQADSTMMKKATNDAAAFIRTISEKRDRNIEWAEKAVREAVSITETEAEEKNVINFIAKDVNELLSKLDGYKIKTENDTITLSTQNLDLIEKDMSFQQNLLNILSDPNIAYILFMIGIYGLLFELYNPGAIFPGVIGGISLILAFYSMHTLPVNYAGVALILLAVVLFILEVNIVSHGALTVGGVVALFFGSIMLIDQESALQAIDISLPLIILVVVLTVLFFLFAIGFGLKAQRSKTMTGADGLVGTTGIAASDINPKGSVKLHGEIWNAESIDEKIEKGEQVVVKEVSNLWLKVKKLS